MGLQLGFAGMPVSMDESVFESIKNDVTFMKELTRHMTLETPDPTDERVANMADAVAEAGDALWSDMREEGGDTKLMRAALARFLEEVAPNNYRARQWGSLRRVRMSDNSYRWLCEKCA